MEVTLKIKKDGKEIEFSMEEVEELREVLDNFLGIAPEPVVLQGQQDKAPVQSSGFITTYTQPCCPGCAHCRPDLYRQPPFITPTIPSIPSNPIIWCGNGTAESGGGLQWTDCSGKLS